MKFANFTPHTIVLNGGVELPSVGVARVANTFSTFDANGVCDVHFGDIQGLPEPQEDTLFVVSALVLSAAKAAGRTDCVAPATAANYGNMLFNVVCIFIGYVNSHHQAQNYTR